MIMSRTLFPFNSTKWIVIKCLFISMQLQSGAVNTCKDDMYYNTVALKVFL